MDRDRRVSDKSSGERERRETPHVFSEVCGARRFLAREVQLSYGDNCARAGRVVKIDGVPCWASSRIRPVDDAFERRLTRGAAQATLARVIQTGKLNYARSEGEEGEDQA